MSALLAVVALTGASPVTDLAMADGVRSLGGFAPFGADELRLPNARFWMARGFSGSGLATADGRVLAFDGRLRDGAAFRKRHGLDSACSDAEAVLKAYDRDDLKLFESLDADAALLLFDASRRRVLLYRDPLGERGLRWLRVGDQWFVSSRGSALIALRGKTFEPDETAAAHFFAMRAPPDDVAWMRGVNELAAGALCWFDDGKAFSRRFKPVLPSQPLRFRDDQEAVEAWHATVREAVRRARADAPTTALMLSGGIDSTLLAFGLSPEHALAVSWAVPMLAQCDETGLAAQTAQALGLRHVIAPTGDIMPLSDLPTWPIEDESPIANPFRRLTQAVYRTARTQGADVLLSGNFGDHIYASGRDWLQSFRQERGTAALFRELMQECWDQGLAIRHDPGLRALLWRRKPAESKALTPWARGLLTPMPPHDEWSRRVEQAYGRATAEDAELGRRFAAAEGLQLRFPYRDPELLRFVLSLPSHYLDSLRGPKWLSRFVMRGRVPDEVRLRPKSGSLTPLYELGVFERQRDLVAQWLWRDDACWPRYLRRTAVIRAWHDPRVESQTLAVWKALSFELWYRAHGESKPFVLASRSLTRSV